MNGKCNSIKKCNMYASRMNAQVTKEVTFTKESVTALVFIISTQRLSKTDKNL